MTFTNALSNAISGMNAATTAVQVRSHNIANATTEGYARRDVALASRKYGGVQIQSIERAGDTFALASRLTADARSANLGLRAETLSQLNLAFGEPGDADGLFAAVSRFSSAIDDLALMPEAASFQQGAVTSAKDLVRTINRLGDVVTSVRTDADANIAGSVAEVNSALKSLETLNRLSGEKELNGLSDIAEQRQQHINIISQALDIKVSPGRGGQVRITTAEGVVLLGERAQQIEFRSGGIVAPGHSMASGHLSGLSVNGIDLTPGGGPQGIRNGSIAGQFAVRDEIAVDFGTRIDTFADDLVARFADGAVDPTLAPGAQGLFVDTGSGAGSASRLSVNAAVDPDQGGALWRMRDGIGATVPGPSAGTGVTQGLRLAISSARPLAAVTDSPSSLGLIDTVGSLASVIGGRTVGAGAIAAAAASTANGLRDADLAATGVNTDQELQSLLLIEQAYAANARVIQAVSDMMARLLEI
ncbi:flagellar hook-associated protein FlgK [Parvularcula sp. LCG005]|uniref:flagellar hook-associated protein FlgK n=1 Tax=Parvularcula sp. LCG005 TaxID=3078805 RepID=UPI002943D43C|nr:flagellar hook-associated protein FlgK [Parvularcula sp. LCG005]WOI52936.1 flagellar hook-associated protein FlgK [Parvularcula sp. LCG005]